MDTLTPTAHAPLAPSAAHRWTACPGSRVAEQAAPSALSSEAADLGTRAHALFAQCLATGASPFTVTDDPGILAFLPMALSLARQIIAGRRVLLETRLLPLPRLSDLWGTADVLCFDQQYRLVAVIDLKTGLYPIEATALQPVIYALLATHMFGVSPHGVATWIIQPRGDHRNGPARGVQYSGIDLIAVERYIRSAAGRTYTAPAVRIPGIWCRFCRAERTCGEHLALIKQI